MKHHGNYIDIKNKIRKITIRKLQYIYIYIYAHLLEIGTYENVEV